MKPRIYVDTSVISALLDKRTPERLNSTREFWSRRGAYELSTSEWTREELSAVNDPDHRSALLAYLEDIHVFPIDEEMKGLADRYVAMGIFPDTLLDDALHVAAAVLTRHDIIVSWNFGHLVNRRRRSLVNTGNVEMDLPRIEILAPVEI